MLGRCCRSDHARRPPPHHSPPTYPHTQQARHCQPPHLHSQPLPCVLLCGCAWWADLMGDGTRPVTLWSKAPSPAATGTSSDGRARLSRSNDYTRTRTTQAAAIDRLRPQSPNQDPEQQTRTAHAQSTAGASATRRWYAVCAGEGLACHDVVVGCIRVAHSLTSSSGVDWRLHLTSPVLKACCSDSAA